MSSSPLFPAGRPFGDLPILRRGGRWLLAAGSTTAPADRTLTVELDRFAMAKTAADRAVAALPFRLGSRW